VKVTLGLGRGRKAYDAKTAERETLEAVRARRDRGERA
jgi:hypothetical protein